jgi:hypothetical protein
MEPPAGLGERCLRREGNDVGARGHDLAHELLVQVDDPAHHLALFRFEQALALPHLDQRLDLLFLFFLALLLAELLTLPDAQEHSAQRGHQRVEQESRTADEGSGQPQRQAWVPYRQGPRERGLDEQHTDQRSQRHADRRGLAPSGALSGDSQKQRGAEQAELAQDDRGETVGGIGPAEASQEAERRFVLHGKPVQSHTAQRFPCPQRHAENQIEQKEQSGAGNAERDRRTAQGTGQLRLLVALRGSNLRTSLRCNLFILPSSVS